MTEAYELYNSMFGIARAIVTQSMMGFHKFDAEQVHEAVSKADEVASLARGYWDSMHKHHEAVERVKAAKVLELDTAGYESEATKTENIMSTWIEAMKKVINSGDYVKDSMGHWKVVRKE